MKKIVILTFLMAAGLLTSVASSAHTRFYGGVYIGGPVWSPPPVYYPAPVYYPPPVIVERVSPPVFVQSAPAAPAVAPAPAQPEYWYYCQDSRTYYPYVQNCRSNWMKVVPNNPSTPNIPGGPPPQ